MIGARCALEKGMKEFFLTDMDIAVLKHVCFAKKATLRSSKDEDEKNGGGREADASFLARSSLFCKVGPMMLNITNNGESLY